MRIHKLVFTHDTDNFQLYFISWVRQSVMLHSGNKGLCSSKVMPCRNWITTQKGSPRIANIWIYHFSQLFYHRHSVLKFEPPIRYVEIIRRLMGRNRDFFVVVDSANGINNNMWMLSMSLNVWRVKDICFTRFAMQIVVKRIRFLLEHLEKFESWNHWSVQLQIILET